MTPDFDVEGILAPIAGDDPAGPSLRYEHTYDRVREARRADDPSLPRGVWTHALKRSDWEGAAALCEAALRDRSKDLQLSAWLLESWLHLHGVAGVAAGFEVMLGLVERFWDGLHPRGADPCDARSFVIEWIDTTAADALGLIAVTTPSFTDAEPHTWATRVAALRLENLARGDAAAARDAEAAGAITLVRFERAVSQTPTVFYSAAAASLRRAEEAAARLQALLDAHCGDAAPGLLRVRGVVAALRGWTEQIVATRPAEIAPEPEAPMSEAPPADESEPPSATEQAAPVAVAAPVPSGAPTSRDDAYRMLTVAAEYLEANEPHSPVPHLVRRAVAWGQLSLPDLMMEFQRNGWDLAALYRLLGFGDDDG
ncbi:MAG TPA: type VI secretion system protein TssA [Longimicrobium sp.]|jgi:type VI secretion system ImpA family protein